MQNWICSKALSRDIDVSLWIDFREFYGNVPLQEVLGGSFVVFNENCMLSFLNSKGSPIIHWNYAFLG